MHLNPKKQSHYKTFLKCAMAGAISFTAMATFALPSDRNQPISLVADRATYNDKTGVTTYTGNVIIEQGTMKLQAASVVAQLNKNRQISTVTATGSPARFQQKMDVNKGLAKGQGQKIVYNADSGIITLTGNAFVDQDGASVKGETLRYSMNKGDIEAIGSSNSSATNTSASENRGRVQIVIPPNTSKATPGAVGQ
ncbi:MULTISPECIES: lipopolysaccharide transport periplasmic protein LptA [Acinetobacter]|uniref:lipopolysaccharide transport periplasmic protein LptA n=1 Tax=Acinetobacter TaxID=469 RepID=UPI0018A2A43D|nr:MULTISPECIES: lipopolysaccharide transport periplasmic protein LptA [Acinetobacter]MBF7690321.1 lipopolysaccharide transport periplasmic protein LptA [Acinetobacter pollinis]MBF7692852.1 lipopolysaccharide transport periplasmic protein LptA [Acinetobacter pollinis]MBF7697823.1 lipopolysaccharide transport periplasmic protein LptA [Acinetobacter pollinis]MBF7700569.1 lipopolysaccharide transport periplasmic protein LptA [Acinetobacter pollinis]WEV49857.1 lipopolysaccharide transport periplas